MGLASLVSLSAQDRRAQQGMHGVEGTFRFVERETKRKTTMLLGGVTQIATLTDMPKRIQHETQIKKHQPGGRAQTRKGHRLARLIPAAC